MTAKELQDIIGEPYIVGDANPFVLGQFWLSEKGLRANHLCEASAEQVIAWVKRHKANQTQRDSA
jgi:hypothetical protein